MRNLSTNFDLPTALSPNRIIFRSGSFSVEEADAGAAWAGSGLAPPAAAAGAFGRDIECVSAKRECSKVKIEVRVESEEESVLCGCDGSNRVTVVSSEQRSIGCDQQSAPRTQRATDSAPECQSQLSTMEASLDQHQMAQHGNRRVHRCGQDPEVLAAHIRVITLLPLHLSALASNEQNLKSATEQQESSTESRARSRSLRTMHCNSITRMHSGMTIAQGNSGKRSSPDAVLC